jgi:phospholipid/cholesterol/gamma-HCH transport system permease protein
MSGFTGVVVGLQGHDALEQIGSDVLTGFISAYVNTREIAPLVSALAMSATVGCGFTAQLGAMRISEEIEKIESAL